MINDSVNKDKDAYSELATSTSLTAKFSTSKDRRMLGTPLADVVQTIAETIVSTVPRHLAQPQPTKEDISAIAATAEPRPHYAKRPLDKELSLEAKKKKGD